jgi:BTB/POZ domain-containing protein KCTD9
MAAFGQQCTIKATSDTNWIRLNVGGRVFLTTRTTLVSRDPDCMFASMFNQESGWNCHTDETGAILIDRSPEYFEPLLNYLRHGQLILDTNVNPRGVLEEAQFYGLKSVIDDLNELIQKDFSASEGDGLRPITRRYFVEKLMLTPVSSKYSPEHFELRCQGLNFEGCDLSKLDLRYVNFKFANLRNVDFTNANLSYCNFERAVLQGILTWLCCIYAFSMFEDFSKSALQACLISFYLL